jgi:hypothetical protein
LEPALDFPYFVTAELEAGAPEEADEPLVPEEELGGTVELLPPFAVADDSEEPGLIPEITPLVTIPLEPTPRVPVAGDPKAGGISGRPNRFVSKRPRRLVPIPFRRVSGVKFGLTRSKAGFGVGPVMVFPGVPAALPTGVLIEEDPRSEFPGTTAGFRRFGIGLAIPGTGFPIPGAGFAIPGDWPPIALPLLAPEIPLEPLAAPDTPEEPGAPPDGAPPALPAPERCAYKPLVNASVTIMIVIFFITLLLPLT